MDLDQLIYIIITIVFLVIGALKKKKVSETVSPKPVSETGTNPTYHTPTQTPKSPLDTMFEEFRKMQEQPQNDVEERKRYLAEIERNRQANIHAVERKKHEAEQRMRDAEQLRKQKEIERKRKHFTISEPSLYQIADSQHASNPILQHQITDQQEMVLEFDLRQAIIQSVILNRKEF